MLTATLYPSWSASLDLPVVGKARPRATVRKSGHAGTYNPGPYRKWLKDAARLVASLWDRGEPWGGHGDPLLVDVVAVLPRPKRKPAGVPSTLWRTGGRVPATRAPDVDNAAGAVLDALTHAGVLADDRYVTNLVARMWWGAIGEPEHIEVCVSRLGREE